MKYKKLGNSLLALFMAFLMVFGMIPPQEAHAKSYDYLNPGDSYSFSKKSNYKKYGAIYVVINKGGEYHLTGSASNMMLIIDPPEGQTATVHLEHVQLSPNNTAPEETKSRAAVTIGDSGGTVILYASPQHTASYFYGQGNMPAIRKDGIKTRLIFRSDKDNNGQIVAKADPKGFRTCAIGCYSPDILGLSVIWANTTGNISFESGRIEAWGSQDLTKGAIYYHYNGGPGIGANAYGSVDGLSFDGADVYAVAGDASSAAIGTAHGTAFDVDPKPTYGSKAKNITINGGRIATAYYRDLPWDNPSQTYACSGASIGAGGRTDCVNLVINGGVIDIGTSGLRPGTGIGAGDEGEAEVTINGGTININAREVGIGAHADGKTTIGIDLPDPPPSPGDDINVTDTSDAAPPANANSSWFGDAKIKINGGNININSDGVCIGGGRNYSEDGKSYIEIRGGNLNLHSTRLPAIGPYNQGSVMKRITIRGGMINAHTDSPATAYRGNGNTAVIGGTYSVESGWHKAYSRMVENIEFTGGTVRVTQGDTGTTVAGPVGAAKGASESTTDDYTKIVISGGNIFADLLDGEKSRPVSSSIDSIAVPVYPYGIRLTGGETPSGKKTTPITNCDFTTKSGTQYDYGLGGVVTFESYPHLSFWLPIDAQRGAVKTEEMLFSDLDAREYSGRLTTHELGFHQFFYPPVKLNLRRSETPSDKDGSAVVRVGDKEVTDFVPADDSGSIKLIASYDSEPSEGVPVLDRFGGFITDTGGNAFIDEDGMWKRVGVKDPYTFNPDYFKTGLDLYAIEEDFDVALGFDANIPQKTQSVLRGKMPAGGVYHYDDSVAIPDNSGFHLNGYSFKGWNTEPDGSGTTYVSGQTGLTGRSFRPDADHPADVILYAQWEPISYRVFFDPGADHPKAEKAVLQYSYDEPGHLAGKTDLLRYGWSQEFDLDLLVGWHYGNSQYDIHDEVLNFVDFDENGNPRQRTVTPVFMEKGQILINVKTDGKGVGELADSITIKAEDGAEYKDCFEEIPEAFGEYRLKDKQNIPKANYTVSIKGRKLNADEASFSYDPQKLNYVELNSYTTTLAYADKIDSVTITPCDGTDSMGRPYAVAPAGDKVKIAAKPSEGYVFTGWACEGTEPEWNPTEASQEITVNGTSVLIPESGAARYTVVFDANGGEGEMGPQKFQVGVAQKLSKCTFTKQGYTFIDWSIKPEGGGRALLDEDVVPDNYPLSWKDGDTVTLYAHWNARQYTVTYHDPSGTFSDGHAQYTYDKESDPVPGLPDSKILPGWTEREDHALSGWRVEGDPDGRIYKPGEQFKNLCTVNEDGSLKGKTLDAVWIPKGNIVISLRKDGCSLTDKQADISITDENGKVYNDYFTEDAENPGWYVYRSEKGKELPAGKYKVSIKRLTVPAEKSAFSYDPGRQVSLDYDFYTLTVRGEENVRGGITGLYYDTQSAAGEDNGTAEITDIDAVSQKVVVFDGTNVGIGAEPAEGYRFDGWSWLGDDGEPQWEEGKDRSVAYQTIKVSKPVDLTAHAHGIVYTVAFDANDITYPGTDPPTGTMPDQSMVYDEPQNLFANTYVRNGYQFSGWNTKKDGSGTAYKDTQSVMNLSTDGVKKTVLYAQWEPRTYEITYVDPANLCATEKQTVRYDENVSLIDADNAHWKPEGHTLRGWEGEALGSSYKPGQKVKNLCTLDEKGVPTGNTLYAVWNDEGSITVVVNVDGKAADIDPAGIVLTGSDGSTFSNCFVKSDTVPGWYIFKPGAGSTAQYSDGRLPGGKYTISIGDYVIPQNKAEFRYDPEKAISLRYDFFTVTMEHYGNADSATVDGKTEEVVLGGTKVTIKATVETGYHFDGWSWLGSEGKPEDIEPDVAEQKITVDRTLVLAAHAKGNVYSVIFDANDDAYPNTEPAVGHMEHQDMVYGEPQQLYPNWYEKTGYEFDGWNTKPDGSGDAYTDKQSVQDMTPDAGVEITLYAQWKAREYTITFKDPYGMCQTEEKTVKYNDPVDLIDVGASGWQPVGHTLRGWESDAPGSSYEPGQEVTNLCSVNADGSLSGTTLYAVWNDDGSITVSLTLDDEGIDVDPDEIVLTGSDGTTYSKCFIKSEMRPGTYLFHSDDPGITPQGDGKLPDGKYTISVPGIVIPDDKAVFEYSSTEATVLVYDYRTVTVKADDNVASATVDGEDSVVVLTGTKVHIKATVENGYHFDGWSWLGDDGKPEDLDAAAAEQDIIADRALELTAHAEGNVYTIVFSQNNDAYPNTEPATGDMEDQDIVFGESQGLFANKFNKKGYLFNGWNTKPDGSGDSYEDGATVQDLSSESGKRITLYAQWKARTYKITYKDPFGLCKTQVQTVNYNDPVNLLDADASGWTPSGHTLAGWEGDAAGSLYEPGKEVVNFCQVNEDGTLTGKNLYAVWADDGCIMVSVTLDDEGVDIDPDDIQLTDSNGTKYKGCFVKSDRAKGIYMYNMKIEEEPEVEDAVPDDELLPGEETVPDGETPDGGDAAPADNGSDNSGSGTGGSGDSGNAPAANEPSPAGDGQGDGGSAGNGAGDDEGASTEIPSTEGQGGGKPAAGGQSDGDAPAATEPTAADTTAAGGASISSSIATAKAEDTISFSIAKPSEIKPAFGTRAAGDGVSGRLPDGEYYVQVLNYKSYGLADVRKKITYRGDQEYASWAYLASDTVKIEAGKHVASATLTDPDTGAETDQTVVPEGAKVDISATVSEEGYHFDSYAYSGIAPDMVMVAALQKITVRGAVTLYAQAAPNTYSIRFDANSGEGKMPDQLMTYDSESKLVAGRFTRTHYYFRGWNDKADGSGTDYKDKAAVSNLTSEDGGVVTLYAQWERKPVYSITYDLNGGTLNGKKGKIVVKADEGDVIKVLKAPTRKGYKFEYWEGSEYYPGDDFTVTEDHVLTAQWKKNKGGGDVPGGGGDDPGGDEIVEDTSTADSDGTQPPETGPEDIEDETTPLTTSENPWALLNLICAGLTTLGAVIALFRKKEEEDQDADEDGDEDEEAARARKAKIAKGAGVVAAAVSIITFILTEKMGGPMHLVDNWTILMAAYLGCQAVTAGMVKKYSKAEEYEDDGE